MLLAGDHPHPAARPQDARRRGVVRAFIRRLLRRRDGAAAVEMALIAPLFLLLLLTTIELGYMIYVQAVLDGAARDAARQVRIGQVQGSGSNSQQLADFQSTLCNDMSAIAVSCSSLIFSVQSYNSFSAINLGIQRNAQGNMTNVAFSPGTACQEVAVTVTYNRPFATAWVAKTIGGSTGSAFLMSTVIFRNEPFAKCT
jgi:Flp pilus assembly protein TadG